MGRELLIGSSAKRLSKYGCLVFGLADYPFENRMEIANHIPPQVMAAISSIYSDRCITINIP
jgi:hypothetical protein